MNNQTTPQQLKNGESIIVRKATSEDAQAIEDMHKRATTQTLYNRYYHHFTHSRKHFEEWINTPANKGTFLVATPTATPEQVIGIAQYVVEYDHFVIIAEPALLVEDRFQGMGVGSILGETLLHIAQENGVEHFHTYMSGSNNAPISLLNKSGLKYKSGWEAGMREIVIDLLERQIHPMSEQRVLRRLVEGFQTL